MPNLQDPPPAAFSGSMASVERLSLIAQREWEEAMRKRRSGSDPQARRWFEAIERDDLEELRLMLGSGVDVEMRNGLGQSGAMLCVALDRPLALRALIQAGAKIDESAWTEECGFAELAAGNGSAQCLRELFEAGLDVETLDREERSPLMVAAWMERPECARACIDHGADVDRMNSDGWTAAMFAVAAGAHPVLRVLLDAGCDLLARSAEGQTALDLARDRRGSVFGSRVEGELDLSAICERMLADEPGRRRSAMEARSLEEAAGEAPAGPRGARI